MKPKVVSLLSGGIDSPVASYLMMKQGCEVILVHFYNYTKDAYNVKYKLLKLQEVLGAHQEKTRLYLVPFLSFQRVLLSFIPPKLRMISYRRMMLKIAEEILKKEKAKAFVTGDSLGQVASQTLDNLAVIYEATKYPILTPLLGFDKEDTVKIAKEIGTYPISIEPYQDSCTFLVPPHPETHAKLEKVKELERPIPANGLIKSAIKEAEVIEK